MKYEDAVAVWGAGKLYCPTCRKSGTAELSSVTVYFEMDKGYACCGGSDPNCYCSFAEAPSFDVLIVAKCGVCNNSKIAYTQDAEYFNFTEVLGEIVDAGGGSISKETL